LVLLIVAADIMKWNAVSSGTSNLVQYIPTLFSALALFVIGLYLANLVKNAVNRLFDSFDLNGAKIISNILFYIIAVIITVTALNQAGINTDLITNNLTIIFGAFLVTASLAFGLGSKEIISDLLKSFYARKNFEIGQKIKFKNVSGTIESIDNISMILKTEDGKIVVPIKDVVGNQVEVES
jgi:small-conductance mechanosensitive channel